MRFNRLSVSGARLTARPRARPAVDGVAGPGLTGARRAPAPPGGGLRRRLLRPVPVRDDRRRDAGRPRAPLLLPCAHDEPTLQLSVFEDVFASAAGAGVQHARGADDRRAALRHRRTPSLRDRCVGEIRLRRPTPSAFVERFGVDGRTSSASGASSPTRARIGWPNAFRRSGSAGLRCRWSSWVGLKSKTSRDAGSRRHRLRRRADEARRSRRRCCRGAPLSVRKPLARRARGLESRPADAANAASEVLARPDSPVERRAVVRKPAEFHATLGLLLDHPPLAETLGLQGRRWVETMSTRERVRELWQQRVRVGRLRRPV